MLEINSLMSNSALTLNKPEISIRIDGSLELIKGQKIDALVLEKENDGYMLQFGSKSFFARSKNPLAVGQWIRLMVLGKKDDSIMLKNVSFHNSEDSEEVTSLKQLIKKHGVESTKDIEKVESFLPKIPIETSQAIKYLLDPSLLAAIIFPENETEKKQQKIEIRYYREKEKKDVWELLFELSAQQLGNLQLSIMMIGNDIYTRIWAESVETAVMLETKIKEIREICMHTEILSPNSGPLFSNKQSSNVDLMV